MKNAKKSVLTFRIRGDSSATSQKGAEMNFLRTSLKIGAALLLSLDLSYNACAQNSVDAATQAIDSDTGGLHDILNNTNYNCFPFDHSPWVFEQPFDIAEIALEDLSRYVSLPEYQPFTCAKTMSYIEDVLNETVPYGFIFHPKTRDWLRQGFTTQSNCSTVATPYINDLFNNIAFLEKYCSTYSAATEHLDVRGGGRLD